MKQTPRNLVARGLARALLAGPVTAQGLRARARAALGPFLWIDALTHALLHEVRPSRWRHLEVAALATLIERRPEYRAAWRDDEPPRVRRYLLRPPTTQRVPPLGLEHCLLPLLPTVGDLAAWLGLSAAALWRLTLPTDWQRRTPLAEQHYRAHWRAKSRGGWRLIEIPAPYLMAVQRRLLHRLLDAVPVHEAAHGGVPGRSVCSHAQQHCGAPLVMRFDLQDFFGSVRAARVHALFHTLGYSREVSRCLTALCTTSTPEPVLARLRESIGMPWARVMPLRDAHLPQGAPTSSAVANLCAFNLDLRLHALAEQWQAHYTRYVDDLVFSGAGLRQGSACFERLVTRIVAEEGFALNHRKTAVLPARRRQQVTGIVVNLARDDFDRLRAELHRLVLGRPLEGPAALHADDPAHWRGQVQWAAQLNPAKAQRLWRLFDQIDWARGSR